MSEEVRYYYLVDGDLIQAGDQWTLSDWSDPDLIFTVQMNNHRIGNKFTSKDLKWCPMRRKIQ